MAKTRSGAAKKRSTSARKRSTSGKTRSTTKRDLLTGKRKSYAKRTATGRFKEIDMMNRSTASDRRKKAKRKVRSGHGDQGDRKQ